jgi:hypothetical protein
VVKLFMNPECLGQGVEIFVAVFRAGKVAANHQWFSVCGHPQLAGKSFDPTDGVDVSGLGSSSDGIGGIAVKGVPPIASGVFGSATNGADSTMVINSAPPSSSTWKLNNPRVISNPLVLAKVDPVKHEMGSMTVVTGGSMANTGADSMMVGKAVLTRV